MDQTTKPLLIPPQFALYAEKHEIFELYQVIYFDKQKIYIRLEINNLKIIETSFSINNSQTRRAFAILD